MYRSAAQKATQDPQYAIALTNARRRRGRIRCKQDDATSHLSDNDEQNTRQSTYSVDFSTDGLIETALESGVLQNCARWRGGINEI